MNVYQLQAMLDTALTTWCEAQRHVRAAAPSAMAEAIEAERAARREYHATHEACRAMR